MPHNGGVACVVNQQTSRAAVCLRVNLLALYDIGKRQALKDRWILDGGELPFAWAFAAAGALPAVFVQLVGMRKDAPCVFLRRFAAAAAAGNSRAGDGDNEMAFVVLPLAPALQAKGFCQLVHRKSLRAGKRLRLEPDALSQLSMLGQLLCLLARTVGEPKRLLS